MTMSTGKYGSEEDYYNKILDFFQHNQDRESIELWRDKSLMELMKILKLTRNKQFVKNALILILALYNSNPIDYYNYSGTSVEFIDKKDKANMISILETEFTEEYPN